MDLNNPHPTLAATIKYLGAEGKTHLLPAALWELLESVNSESPHYNNAHVKSIGQGLDSLMHDFYRDLVGEDLRTQITGQQLSGLYKDFSKGMMYAAKHFEKTDEGSDIHKIETITFINPPPQILHAYGFATNDGRVVGMYPNLVSMYVSQDNLRSTGELPGQGRIYEDDKVPGRYFNASEMAILTGIEEACHAQQMLKGRYTQEYDLADLKDEAYMNAKCEKEAAALQQDAVVKLGLGAPTPDPEFGVPLASPPAPANTDKQVPQKRRHLPSRRRLLQAGGGLLLLGIAGAIIKGCSPEQLGNPDFNVPTPPPRKPRANEESKNYEKAYKDAYAALEASLPGAIGDIQNESGQFDLGDLARPLKFDITVIPSHGHLQGALEYSIQNDTQNRSGKLPNFNRMLNACLEIAVLDEETHIAKTNKALDYDTLATKIVHHLQKDVFIPNPKQLKDDIRNVVRGVTETSVPFVIQPAPGISVVPDKAPSREKTFLVSGKTLNFTVMNPLLPENQRLAGQINSGRIR